MKGKLNVTGFWKTDKNVSHTAHQLIASHTAHQLTASHTAHQLTASHTAHQLIASHTAHQLIASHTAHQLIASHTAHQLIASYTRTLPMHSGIPGNHCGSLMLERSHTIYIKYNYRIVFYLVLITTAISAS